MTGYLPRPELKIRDRKGPLLSYTYTKTVQKLSHHLSLEFLQELYKFARTNLPEEEVVERFLVLTSDLLCITSPDLLSMSIDEVSPPEAVVPDQGSSSVPQIAPSVSLTQAPLPVAPYIAPVSSAPPLIGFSGLPPQSLGQPTSSSTQVAPFAPVVSQPSGQFLDLGQSNQSAIQTSTSFNHTSATPTGTPPILTQAPNISTPSTASGLPLANLGSPPPGFTPGPSQPSQFSTATNAIHTQDSLAVSQESDSGFLTVSKRNRSRFAPKSAPYPTR